MITMDNGIDQLEELRRTIVLNDNDTIYMFINDYKALPLNEITELQKKPTLFLNKSQSLEFGKSVKMNKNK